ncbi:unnamed protein product [Rotaria sp. Silwood1]|nr:unnamed protein product [Rotaria sp. Silwood1]
MNLDVSELERLNTSRLHIFSRVIERNKSGNMNKQRKLSQCINNKPVKPSEPLIMNSTSQTEDDSVIDNVMVDSSETSSRFSGTFFFSLQNPIFIPSLFGSFGVLCVFIILCRKQLYRLLIFIIYGNGFYDRKSNSSRLKQISKHRQYHYMSTLNKP